MARCPRCGARGSRASDWRCVIRRTSADKGRHQARGGTGRALPAWLWRWLGGIVATAQPKGKIGLLVLRTPRMPDADALVVLRMADWVALTGPDGTLRLAGATEAHERLTAGQSVKL